MYAEKTKNVRGAIIDESRGKTKSDKKSQGNAK